MPGWTPSRRQFLQSAAFGVAAWQTRGLLAEELARTPALTEGPFYPDKLPLDTDNDLLILNESLTPAVGEITHLSGRVLGLDGQPVRNAFVEIWQVCVNGAYLHSGDRRHEQRDQNFQGYGRFLTDAEGRYYFRTIKPVPYPGRAPHIHYGISRHGRRVLTTQLLIAGAPENERDGVFRSAESEENRRRLLVEFQPLANSKIGELTARFDIVLGATPADAPAEDRPAGLGKPEGNGPGRRPPRS
jgi:protocatechuate 3,4-dioxygenase beta subunit